MIFPSIGYRHDDFITLLSIERRAYGSVALVIILLHFLCYYIIVLLINYYYVLVFTTDNRVRFLWRGWRGTYYLTVTSSLPRPCCAHVSPERSFFLSHTNTHIRTLRVVFSTACRGTLQGHLSRPGTQGHAGILVNISTRTDRRRSIIASLCQHEHDVASRRIRTFSVFSLVATAGLSDPCPVRMN